jgi:Sulfotransferase family
MRFAPRRFSTRGSRVSEIRAARPLGLRLLNAAGGALHAAGVPLVRLDEASLLRAATRVTALSDLGDEHFREPFRHLLASFEQEARLTTLGRIIARRDLIRLLVNRLRVQAVWSTHPELAAGTITGPLFVLGLPRTGTSILHELLAQDPAHRVPMSWEVMHPYPPPEAATFSTDARIDQVDRHLAGIDRLIPDFKAVHPMGARLPQECVAITAHDFASMQFHTTNRLPSYQAWLDEADLTWVYQNHRRWLQYLQWKAPANRWVLKSPGHLWALDALLTVYPDAQFPEFMRDEVGMVQRIYHHFGWTLSAEAESRMRQFLRDNRADKHGRHRYRLGLGGLDEAGERRRFQRYQDRFAVAAEPVD